MRIVVVRHGQAVPKKTWEALDSDRPLTERGRRQALRLSKLIGSSRPVRVISSPASRCVETVTPLADQNNLSVELSERLSTDSPAAAVELCRQLVSSEPIDSTIVLCTHREVLVELLPHLSNEFRHKITHRPPGAKGGAWILRFRNQKLTRADYRPPTV